MAIVISDNCLPTVAGNRTTQSDATEGDHVAPPERGERVFDTFHLVQVLPKRRLGKQ